MISDIRRGRNTCTAHYYSLLNSTSTSPLVRENTQQDSPKVFRLFLEVHTSSEEINMRLTDIFSSSQISIVRATNRLRCITSSIIVVLVISAPFVVSANRRWNRGLLSFKDVILQPLDCYLSVESPALKPVNLITVSLTVVYFTERLAIVETSNAGSDIVVGSL